MTSFGKNSSISLLVVIRLTVVLALLLQLGCALPPLENRLETKAFTEEQTADSRLGRTVSKQATEEQGASGIVPLTDPVDAFVARALLAELSDYSLDVQYYIWQNDTAGNLLIRALYEAAERGVRVRLLLDDNGIAGMDPILAALDQHKNVEIRLFNPFKFRTSRALGFITDFSRLNRRMHNKSFTADSQATIVGGRNIADEYFGSGSGVLFSDLDVLAVGAVAEAVARDFDRYWASRSSYPVDLILPVASSEDLESLEAELASVAQRDDAQRFIDALKSSELVRQALDEQLSFERATVALVSDDPGKVLGKASEHDRVSQQLAAALGEPERSVIVVSPYFVPGKDGVELFRKLEERGVDVKILTNSLEANDVALVHSGYAKYRKSLLAAGVELFEMRKSRGQDVAGKLNPKGPLGSSSASLHAKTFAVDSETLFVGSFNFDPRSNNINTEMGFLMESSALAGALEAGFPERVLEIAYQVKLNEQGDLIWLEHNKGQIITHTHEPNVGWFSRTLVALFSFLPIDPLL
jgi:putative cardiolipin synthase